jgi:hypothetical protein
MSDVEEEDINIKQADNPPAMSASQRQWEQVLQVKNNTKEPLVIHEGLAPALLSLNYPLHFIDFETMTAAIPFNRGRRPYEQIAFQFSHHILHKDGLVEHVDQYINTEPGVFPNFDFLRALMKSLSNDNGTILRYSAHENTVLCQIYEQLKYSDVKDKDNLCDFIKKITYKKAPDDKAFIWKGERNMVDLWEMVKYYYLHPLMCGSNSIKNVLPAVLSESAYLKNKYCKPIYGARGGIKSLNFNNWTWVKTDDTGIVIDPYKQLPNVFSEYDRETLDLLLDDDTAIANGATAMTAYAKMQFTEMSVQERERITSALLKYCELDTLAMVMIVEHWLELVNSSSVAA